MSGFNKLINFIPSFQFLVRKKISSVSPALVLAAILDLAFR